MRPPRSKPRSINSRTKLELPGSPPSWKTTRPLSPRAVASNTRDKSTESVVNPKKRTSDKAAIEYGAIMRKLARSWEDGDGEDVDEAVEEKV